MSNLLVGQEKVRDARLSIILQLRHHSDMYQLSSGMGVGLAQSSFMEFIIDRIRLTFSTSTAIPKGQNEIPNREPSNFS